MADFAPCWAFTEQEEGGYSDTPGDAGGATKWGITRATLAAWWHRYVTKAEVEALEEPTAQEIARKEYWVPLRGDELPAGVDLVVFDFGFNAGWSRSAKLLQRVVEETQDGQIGPKTLAAVAKFSAGAIIDRLSQLHEVYYETVVEEYPGDEKFLAGWLGRAGRAAQAALKLAHG